MENPEVARALDEVADLLDLQGANPFRIRAYRNAARTISNLTQPLVELVQTPGRKLDDLPGIGEDLACKITTLLNTGNLPLLTELRAQLPPGLRDLLGVPGLGPKRAVALYKKSGIHSLDQLRDAARRQQIRGLRGFGEKTEAAILQGIDQIQQTGKRFYLAEAKVYADALSRHLGKVAGVERVDIAGSFRRRQETVGDLDILIVGNSSAAAMDALANFEGVTSVVARGETKMTVRLRTGMQVDLRLVPAESYGAALLYFTGSKAHNIALRRRAQERRLKMNEYGVFRGKKCIAGDTEAAVYATVDLPWIAPEMREDRGEIAVAEAHKLPTLIELGDIRGDLHMHTTATDGRATIAEMLSGAKARGYSYIAITDHSKRVTMAHGLDAARLRKHWRAIDRAAAKVPGITVLKGVELDILEDGRLDLPDDVLAEADWVVASIHYGQNQSKERITRRITNAIEHPHVHAIGHPTGRLIGHRAPYAVDLETVFKAAADHGCLMELNCQPSRLDLNDLDLQRAKKHGVGIVLGTDGHSVEELGFMEFGLFQARRAWLEAADVVNTRSLGQFRKRLKC